MKSLLRVLALGSILGTQSLAANTPPRAIRPNVILITIDTVRADHIGCYGAKRSINAHARWLGPRWHRV